MVKHTEAIRRLTNCLSVFDHFVGLALKRLKMNSIKVETSDDVLLLGITTDKKKLLNPKKC